MPTHDVDFAHVRANADFGAVLANLGIEYQQGKSQIKVHCPFHDDEKPSCSVNLEKRVFHCFPCEEKGNVIDFMVKAASLQPRQAAIKVAELSGISLKPDGSTPASKPAAKAKKSAGTTKTENVKSEGPNKPLTFTLKVDAAPYHPWFVDRGIAPGRIEDWGIGLAEKGMMKDRLVFPIHNKDGELVAYCGRWPADEEPDEDTPKYKFPPGFRKELEIFGLSRIEPNSGETAVLVESFLSVVQHLQPDTPVLSTMGRSISQEQIELLKAWGFKRVVVLFDGDEPGRQGATDVAGMIATAGLWTKVGNLPDGVKPHHINYKTMIKHINGDA